MGRAAGTSLGPVTGDIREADTGTAPEAMLRRMAELRGACRRAAAPRQPNDPVDAYVASLRHPHGDTRHDLWVVGDPVRAYLLLISDTAGTGYAHLYVAPEHRRRGLGRALLDRAVSRAREIGLRTVSSIHGDEAGAGFAAAVGAQTGKTNVRSALTMPPNTVAVTADGYHARSWIGAAPEELIDSYVAARHAINDAPSDEGDATEVFTRERIRDHERTVRRRGRQLRITVAVDGAGAVAGFNELIVDPDPGSVASTEDTAVLPAHRGRGVATLVKVEALRLLAADRPDITQVTTTNAATNGPMLAVNRRLGFEPVGRWTGAVLRLR